MFGDIVSDEQFTNGEQMNIPYTDLVVVPVMDGANNRKLMELLAEQIQLVGRENQPTTVIVLQDGVEGDVVVGDVATELRSALTDLGMDGSLLTRSIGDARFPKGTDSDENVKRIIEVALRPAPEQGILVIVLDQVYARKVTRIFLWDFLNNRDIDPEIDQVFRPGEAGHVSRKCGGSRNVLYPEGQRQWAIKAYLGYLS